MKALDVRGMAEVRGGSRNCGNWLETFVITKTCSVAGGFIGLPGGPWGAYIGMAAGSIACDWICHYGC